MENNSTTLFHQIIQLLPANWSQPELSYRDADHYSAAHFAAENIIVTMINNPDTDMNTASYQVTGKLPEGLDEEQLKKLIGQLNDFLLQKRKIEQGS